MKISRFQNELDEVTINHLCYEFRAYFYQNANEPPSDDFEIFRGQILHALTHDGLQIEHLIALGAMWPLDKYRKGQTTDFLKTIQKIVKSIWLDKYENPKEKDAEK